MAAVTDDLDHMPVVRNLADFDLARFVEILSRYFTVETLEEDIRRPAGRAWAVSKVAEHGGKSTAFLMVTAQDHRVRILTLRDDVDVADAELPESETLRALDVTVLHTVVLQHVLGLSLDQEIALLHCLAHKAKLPILKVPDAALRHVRGSRTRTGTEISALHQQNIHIVQRQVTDVPMPLTPPPMISTETSVLFLRAERISCRFITCRIG